MNNNIEPYEGFIKGNLFENLYIPYKNYQIKEINPNNKEEYDLLLVQIYAFTLQELTLYLDTNPEDENAIRVRAGYQKLYDQAKENFETNYYPLCLDKTTSESKSWEWLNSWPWEVDNNV